MVQADFFKSFWPQSEEEDFLDVAKKRTIILFGLAGGLITLLSGLRHFFANNGAISLYEFILVIICPLVFLASPIVVRQTRRINLVFTLFMSYAYVMVLANHFNGGGVVSHATFFLVTLCCMISVNYGWRGALGSSLAAIAHIAVLVSIRDKFPAGVDVTQPGALEVWLASGLVFVVILVSVTVAAYQSEMKRAVEKLAEARAAAEGANRAKSEFLATMSHEIRTPMNGILGMATLLRGTTLTDKQQLYADTIGSSGTALLTIINDILDFSKVEAGKLEFDEASFDLCAAIEDVAALLRFQAREKGVSLSVVFDPSARVNLLGDVGRIRQAITNLIGNAVKFTHDGSVTVRICVRCHGDHADVQIEVEDTGIGIAPEQLNSIFEQFTQAECSTTRKYGGTGLGLPITRALIEAMGGRVGVRSVVGAGSCFTLELNLPIAPASSRQVCGVAEEEPDRSGEGGSDEPVVLTSPGGHQARRGPRVMAAKPSILIAEDNAVNRMVMQHMVDPNRFHVAFAENGKIAYDMACADQYDIILMDISMPEMDGIEAMTAIRAHEIEQGLSPVPIIALTAHAMVGDRETFLTAGMSDYLEKPVQKERIYAVMEKWLNHHEKSAHTKAG